MLCPPEQEGDWEAEREREREGEKQRGGPSNSTGVRTHWIVWSSWVARLFLAQSNRLALYWLHWWEEEASCFIPKTANKHFRPHLFVWRPSYMLLVWERTEVGGNWRSKQLSLSGAAAGLWCQHSKSTSTSLQQCFYPHCCSGLYSADSRCFRSTD